jgi:hypothetical protein
MPILLIVEKSGSIKELNVKSYAENELYKKAGFKTEEGFHCATQWDIELASVEKSYRICVYGKTKGKANQENKYDFPPPVDKVLFFGSCILVSDTGALKKTEWEKIYEELFGGFEDIGDEDTSDDEDDEDDDLPRTKSGYAKDGFVVDDDEDEEEDEEEEEEDDDEDEEEVIKVKPQKPQKKKAKNTVFEKIDTLAATDDISFLDCTSELEEEAYL